MLKLLWVDFTLPVPHPQIHPPTSFKFAWNDIWNAQNTIKLIIILYPRSAYYRISWITDITEFLEKHFNSICFIDFSENTQSEEKVANVQIASPHPGL